MIKILFLCHGNICRSPMAKFIMRDKVERLRISKNFEIDSAAISTEEGGNPIYPPARQILLRHGIMAKGHSARLVTKRDYNYYNLIFVMDGHVMEEAKKLLNNDPKNKIKMISSNFEVDDPWYTGDFEQAYDKIDVACDEILQNLGF